MSGFLDLILRLLRGPGASPPGTAGPLQRPGPGATPHRSTSTSPSTPRSARGYPGDYEGLPEMAWTPQRDGRPDPGEIVWTWVPFEEDHTQGKDRPVLLIGRDGRWLLGLQLTSQDHDRDEAQERAAGRLWCDIGTGPWDRRGRASEVRVNRILRLDADSVRREGAVLDRERFDVVAAAVRAARR